MYIPPDRYCSDLIKEIKAEMEELDNNDYGWGEEGSESSTSNNSNSNDNDNDSDASYWLGLNNNGISDD